MASSGSEVDVASDKITTKGKKSKGKEREAGIIYLSRVPPYMSVKNVRHLLGVHGEIGRVFLQPDGKKL